MTDQQLQEIESRLNAGIQWGPDECGICISARGETWADECSCLGNTIIQLGGDWEGMMDDWIFCAHARKDMRTLLEELKSIRKPAGSHITVCIDKYSSDDCRCGNNVDNLRSGEHCSKCGAVIQWI